MMGSSEVEIDKVLQSEKADLRILGFDEEEKRLRQRMLDKPSAMLKLPRGQYIFCDFRTLQIPGIEVCLVQLCLLLFFTGSNLRLNLLTEYR